MIRIEAGTGSATATRTTYRMTVANSISRRLKPCCRTPSFVAGPCISFRPSRASTDSLPGWIGWIWDCGPGPDLRASGGKQNHGAIPRVRVVGIADIENIHAVGD